MSGRRKNTPGGKFAATALPEKWSKTIHEISEKAYGKFPDLDRRLDAVSSFLISTADSTPFPDRRLDAENGETRKVVQSQSIARTKYIISELTPHFAEAIRNRSVSEHDALHAMERICGSLTDIVGEIENSMEWARMLAAFEDAITGTVVKKIIESPQMPNSYAAREKTLREILVKKGLSVRAWAREAKVDSHTADKILRFTTKKPRPDSLKQLADVLGVEIEELRP